MIRERQEEYDVALAACDRAGQTTGFIEFLLSALDAGVIERTLPDKPNSSLQQYRLRKIKDARRSVDDSPP